ncbi:hypothetical protein Tco_1487444 [Tanacetum coccineum]
MIPKIERLSRVYELQGFPYGLKHAAAPSWLLLSYENRPCNLGYGVLGFWIWRMEILVKLGLDTLYFGKVKPGYAISA